jgi:hypothetical protein
VEKPPLESTGDCTDDVWLVSLSTDSLKTVAMRTYQDLPEAMETAHEWLLMLADETEIVPDVRLCGHGRTE